MPALLLLGAGSQTQTQAASNIAANQGIFARIDHKVTPSSAHKSCKSDKFEIVIV
jgi:hypothetical protein